eukprot:m.199400 g.199400  ORF g.199400 m.199400 type:complete len:84 (-) comp32732_c1_seq2:2029-2280(-)
MFHSNDINKSKRSSFLHMKYDFKKKEKVSKMQGCGRRRTPLNTLHTSTHANFKINLKHVDQSSTVCRLHVHFTSISPTVPTAH